MFDDPDETAVLFAKVFLPTAVLAYAASHIAVFAGFLVAAAGCVVWVLLRGWRRIGM